MGAAVFRLQLHRKWTEILEEWEKEAANPQHCKKDAPMNSKCPTNKWFCQCPCQPGSEAFHIRPVDGPTLFLVPPPNVDSWTTELSSAINLKSMGIQLAVAFHGNENSDYAMDRSTISRLRTVRDKNNSNATLPRSRASDHPAQRGLPSKESTSIFVLTSWQSWDKASKAFDEEHKYTYTHQKRKIVETETVYRFQCGFAIVDECHGVKSIGLGMWRSLRKMRDSRPDYRFWLMAMSGTIINSDPLDIAAPIDILCDASWNDPNHKYYHFRPAGLRKLANTVARCIGKAEARKELTEAIDTFANILPDFLMRRHEMSNWHGHDLVKLEKLHRAKVKTLFPPEFLEAFNSIVTNWKSTILEKLQRRQENWDKNQYLDSFRRNNPERPTAVDSGQAFAAARLLRLCSCLPYLAASSHGHEQKWTNNEVEKECMNRSDGRMREGCVLDNDYATLQKTSTKLKAITGLLEKHKGANVLIMSSFTEMVLVVERVSLFPP